MPFQKSTKICECSPSANVFDNITTRQLAEFRAREFYIPGTTEVTLDDGSSVLVGWALFPGVNVNDPLTVYQQGGPGDSSIVAALSVLKSTVTTEGLRINTRDGARIGHLLAVDTYAGGGFNRPLNPDLYPTPTTVDLSVLPAFVNARINTIEGYAVILLKVILDVLAKYGSTPSIATKLDPSKMVLAGASFGTLITTRAGGILVAPYASLPAAVQAEISASGQADLAAIYTGNTGIVPFYDEVSNLESLVSTYFWQNLVTPRVVDEFAPKITNADGLVAIEFGPFDTAPYAGLNGVVQLYRDLISGTINWNDTSLQGKLQILEPLLGTPNNVGGIVNVFTITSIANRFAQIFNSSPLPLQNRIIAGLLFAYVRIVATNLGDFQFEFNLNLPRGRPDFNIQANLPVVNIAAKLGFNPADIVFSFFPVPIFASFLNTTRQSPLAEDFAAILNAGKNMVSVYGNEDGVTPPTSLWNFAREYQGTYPVLGTILDGEQELVTNSTTTSKAIITEVSPVSNRYVWISNYLVGHNSTFADFQQYVRYTLGEDSIEKQPPSLVVTKL